jgi:hypothetical protein
VDETGYFAIDPAVVWAVAVDDLAGLVDVS